MEGLVKIHSSQSNSFNFFVFVHVICVLCQDLDSAEMKETDSETTKPPSFILSEEIAVIFSIASDVV